MKFYLLASGSKGNCTIIETKNHDLVMIDCGLSIAQIKKRMEICGLSIDKVKALLITHTHADHCLSVRAFDNIPVYISSESEMNEFNTFEFYTHLEICGLDFFTLEASHDSQGTANFVICEGDSKAAYITDTGYISVDNERAINNCDIFMVESNHDPRMLMMTNRPPMLKSRILGPCGHLSNQDAAYELGKVIGVCTKEIILLHRSEEANDEELMYETFNRIINDMGVNVSNIKVHIARQNEPVVSGEY